MKKHTVSLKPTNHPGFFLGKKLEELNMSQSELATRMGRPAQTINMIIKQKKAVTPETAIQLEYVTGILASVWNTYQKDYDVQKVNDKRPLNKKGEPCGCDNCNRKYGK